MWFFVIPPFRYESTTVFRSNQSPLLPANLPLAVVAESRDACAVMISLLRFAFALPVRIVESSLLLRLCVCVCSSRIAPLLPLCIFFFFFFGRRCGCRVDGNAVVFCPITHRNHTTYPIDSIVPNTVAIGSNLIDTTTILARARLWTGFFAAASLVLDDVLLLFLLCRNLICDRPPTMKCTVMRMMEEETKNRCWKTQ